MRRLRDDDRGGVAVLSAAAAGLICALAAAIDVGAVALEGRRLQGAADLAALSAVVRLDRAHDAATETASANAPDLTRVHTETGVYTADPAVAPETRFQAGGPSPNAVRVTLQKETPLYFSALLLGRQTFTLRRRAHAARPHQPRAAFSLGSRVARLDGGVANALLGALSGSQVSLSLADWQALVAADVDLLAYWRALATEVDGDLVRPDALLDGRIDAGRALRVLEGVADPASRSAVSALSRALAGRSLRLGDMLALEPGAEDLLAEGLTARVSTLDLIMATAAVAGGERQAELSLGARPGLASVRMDLAIGEPPNRTAWMTVARNGQPVIRTRQIRLLVRAVTSDGLSGLARVDLPVLVEAAPSEARLSRIECASGTVVIDARPGLARVAVGAVDPRGFTDFTRDLAVQPAVLLDVAGVASVRARSEIEAAQTAFRPLTWSAAEVADRATRTVATTSMGESLVSSLLGRMEVEARLVGLGLGAGGLTRALSALLAPVGVTLDGLLIPLLDLLGVRLGEADVTLNGLDCRQGGPRLVG